MPLIEMRLHEFQIPPTQLVDLFILSLHRTTRDFRPGKSHQRSWWIVHTQSMHADTKRVISVTAGQESTNLSRICRTERGLRFEG